MMLHEKNVAFRVSAQIEQLRHFVCGSSVNRNLLL